jgi:hypothetical protein
MIVRGKADRLPAPYLGPEPVPSQSFGIVYQVLCGLAAAVFLARGVLYLERWSAAQSAAELSPPFALAGVRGGSTGLLALVESATFAVVVLAIVGSFVWRRNRRPKDALAAYGEAGVEMPLGWVLPMWLRVVTGVAVIGGAFGIAKGAVRPDMFLADLPGARLSAAVGSLGWAIAWLLTAAWPVFANRAQDRRSAWSTWYRQRPGSVPFVEPVKGEDTDIGEPEGAGWVLRTAGLVVSGLVSSLFVAGGLSGLAAGDPTGIWFFVPGALVSYLVVRAFIRRRRR